MDDATLQRRINAVVAFAAGLGEMELAKHALRKLNDACNMEMPTNVTRFITHWWDKFVSTGGVHDLPRAGRERKVPNWPMVAPARGSRPATNTCTGGVTTMLARARSRDGHVVQERDN